VEAVISSGISVNAYQTKWRHIPEDSMFYDHRHEASNLSYKMEFLQLCNNSLCINRLSFPGTVLLI
jgi:hypothetical protein